MAIQSATSISLTSASSDTLLVGLSIVPFVESDGVTISARATLTTQHARPTSAGPLAKIGDPVTETHIDVYSDAANDPALASALTAIYGALQAYCAAKGK